MIINVLIHKNTHNKFISGNKYENLCLKGQKATRKFNFQYINIDAV
jgi:hypothetical protein